VWVVGCGLLRQTNGYMEEKGNKGVTISKKEFVAVSVSGRSWPLLRRDRSWWLRFDVVQKSQLMVFGSGCWPGDHQVDCGPPDVCARMHVDAVSGKSR